MVNIYVIPIALNTVIITVDLLKPFTDTKVMSKEKYFTQYYSLVFVHSILEESIWSLLNQFVTCHIVIMNIINYNVAVIEFLFGMRKFRCN